ncbi:MAG: PD-(D/E)XK nuclease family protein [bacterium]
MRFLRQVYSKAMEYDTKNTAIILPSQRACVYLREEFKNAGKTMILPDIITMEQFAGKMSNMAGEEHLNLALYAYRIYSEKAEDSRDFDSFLPIFSIILTDFNDIDMYEVSVDQLDNLKEIAELEYREGGFADKYFNVMEIFKDIYVELNDILKSKGTGYRGMIYKEALSSIENSELPQNIIFAGFNILTPVEKQIIDALIKKTDVDLLFNIPDLLLDNNHEAAYFINKHLKKWPDYAQSIDCSRNESVRIHEYSLPTDQIKILADEFEEGKGSVVLCDESLMLPAVNGIPDYVEKINITMGYPIQMTPAFMFYKSIMQLHVNKNANGFNRKDILNLLENKYANRALGGKKYAVRGRLASIQEMYVTPDKLFDDFHDSDNWAYIFNWYDSSGEMKEPVEILQYLVKIFQSSGEDDERDELKESIIIKMVNVFNRLITLFSCEKNILSSNKPGKLDSLVTNVLSEVNVPFSGDPLQDFQIMGMLETRCLDFEKTVIMSVNEGIIPKGKRANSFIPFDVRTHPDWNLPTYRDNDKLFSYYFYTLLLDTRESIVTYAKSGDENYTEAGRFIEQLKWENRPNGIFSEENFTPIPDMTNAGNPKGIDKIEKTDEMIKIIKKKSFSYSGIATYIRNPVDYFMKYVIGIRDESEIDEVGVMEIGTAAHEVLRKLYSPQKGKAFDKSLINMDEDYLDSLAVEGFGDKVNTGKGKPYIMKKAVVKMLHDFIKQDISRIHQKVILKDMEVGMNAPINVNGSEMTLFGIFDRIEVEKEANTLRIMDYKSGTVKDTDLIIRNKEELINLDAWKEGNNYDKIVQLLFYGYIAYEHDSTDDENKLNYRDYDVNLGIYSLRQPNTIYYLKDKEDNPIYYNEDIHSKFKSIIEEIISEIINKDIPFEYIERKEWG